MHRRFIDRTDAGRALAERLGHLAGEDCIVLALPRGGLPVAYEVARALRAPLDVLNVRKLGVPSQPELAMGAVSTGGVRVLSDEVIRDAGVSMAEIEIATQAQRQEIDRRERLYRRGRPAPRLAGRTVILVDDGIATGASLSAALEALRECETEAIVVAVPVVDSRTAAALRRDCTELVSVFETPRLDGVGRWYRDFSQTPDGEVRILLAAARALLPAEAGRR